jgi:hypothetical protein
MQWLAEQLEDGEIAYRIGRDGNELVAEWLGVVRLVSLRDGAEFRFEPDPGAEPRDVEKIVQGSGQLLLRHLQGKLALHGAAVEIDGRAVVLLGESSDGKSTLAASLCRRPCVKFLADDAVALELTADTYSVVPLERNHWLEASAREALGHEADPCATKEPVSAREVGSGGAPLVGFVELSFGDVASPTVRPRRGLSALAKLMPQIVRFVIDEPDYQRRELDAIIQLVDRVPMASLERPRRLDQLEATTDLVIDLVRASVPCDPRSVSR